MDDLPTMKLSPVIEPGQMTSMSPTEDQPPMPGALAPNITSSGSPISPQPQAAPPTSVTPPIEPVTTTSSSGGDSSGNLILMAIVFLLVAIVVGAVYFVFFTS